MLSCIQGSHKLSSPVYVLFTRYFILLFAHPCPCRSCFGRTRGLTSLDIFCTRGPKYLEVDVDVGSSQTAARVVGIVQGALKGLVIDIAVLLEGKTKVSPHLPRQCTRDFRNAY